MEGENDAHGDPREQKAEDETNGDGQNGTLAKSAEELPDALIATVEVFLINLRDLVGYFQHGYAARKDFVAKKSVAVLLALGGRPFEDGIQQFP